MAFDEKLATRVRAYFDECAVAFDEKRMMGGLCFMVDDKMCVGVSEARLMARLDPDIYETVLKRKGCGPMDFTGRPLRGFVFVEAEALRTRKQLARWLDLALEFNPRAVSSKRRAKSTATPVRERRK